MSSQLRILKINLSISTQKKTELKIKTHTHTHTHMNLDLPSFSSRTHKSTNPKKKIIQTQKIKPRKIINEYCIKQNQSTYIHKPNYPKQNQSTYTNTNPAQPYQHKAKLKLKNS